MSAAPPSVTADPPAAGGATGRRLVVISYHFPPDGFIGGMRWAGLTKYLAELGWTSWVITAAPPSDTAPAGVTVVSCPRRRTMNDRYQEFRVRTAGVGPKWQSAGPGTPVAPRARWLARLRLEAAMLLSLPDQARGWILTAAREARRIIGQVHPDVVVSSGPPHSAHLAAWLATRGTGVRWVADLRDPWAGPISAPWRSSPYFRSHLARGLATWSERLVARSASSIVCNTRQFADAMQQRHAEVSVRWMPNAVDHEILPPVTAERFPGLGLVHVGTLYGGRDFNPVLQALRRFLDLAPAAAREGAMLRIAGDIQGGYRDTVERQAAELGLDAHVAYQGVIPRTAALELVSRSRLAVVLAQGQQVEVPAKLYEMIALGVPTVVVASLASAASSEAARLGAWAVDPADLPGLVRVMNEAWAGRGCTPPARQPMLDYRELASVCERILLRDDWGDDFGRVAPPTSAAAPSAAAP